MGLGTDPLVVPALPAGYRGDEMSAADLDGVLVVEHEAFPDEPWTRGMFQRELQISFSRSVVVRDADDSICAYVCWRRLGDELEILNLAVRQSARKHGLGRALVRLVIDDARRRGATKIHLEVHEDNEAAIFLYRSCEFSSSGLRRHYYGRDHHALLMSWTGGIPSCAEDDVDKQKRPD